MSRRYQIGQAIVEEEDPSRIFHEPRNPRTQEFLRAVMKHD